jgi:transketolase
MILIATGPEVGLALEAGRKIAEENGTNVRVVSMPCWELFEEQPVDYREEVLPPDVRARLSIEPGVELGWKRWVGDHGDSIALSRYGASAPGATVLEQLGFNVDNVVARATALLERVG